MNSKKFISENLSVLVIVVGLLSCLLSLSMDGCSRKKPIRVGFAGELTGGHADLGVHGRNGAQLAVETINAAGGVAGRPIELLVRDDLGTPEGAQAADRKLIDAGVVAIIGHMTSAQSVAAMPMIEEAGIVLLSPTTSTTKLAELDDHFFRVNPVNSTQARKLGRHVYRQRGLSRIAVIYDADNAAYTRTYLTAFVEHYSALGGQVVGRVRFSSAHDQDFAPLVAELQAGTPEGLVIIASAIDTALIAQQTRLSAWQTPLFSSGWSLTEALIQNGGQAVEGIEIVQHYDSNSQAPVFLDFKVRYQARFGLTPAFAATLAYEAVLVLAAALDKTDGQAKGLPQAMREIQDFKGLIGTISLDKYGDAVRTQFVITIRDGQFVVQDVLEP